MPDTPPPAKRASPKPDLSLRAGATVFLERDIYRRRRLVDAAKWLPLAGLLLFVAPALLLGTPSVIPSGDGSEGAEGASTAMRLVYFIFAWVCLIGICAVISRGLVEEVSEEPEQAGLTPHDDLNDGPNSGQRDI